MHRVLVIGVGSIGERHLRCFGNTGRCEMAFCESNPKLRATIAERYANKRAFALLDDALNAGDYAAAVVATPAPLHVPMATQLARRGIHLLLEKPLSLSLEGVDALRAVVREKSLAVAVGYTHRAHPAQRALKQALSEGRFGKPLQLTLVSGQNFPTYRPAYRTIYFASHAQGGGGIQDACTHMYNLGEWMVGPIERLVADAAHQALEGVTVEDTVHTIARHGGVLASYALCMYQAPNEIRLTVVCERATARVEYAPHRWSWMTDPGGEWHHEPVEVPERDTMYVAQANAFLDTMEGKAPPLCSLDEGIQTLKVNLAVLRSVQSGRWEKV